MPLVIEMQVKLLFAYGDRRRLFGFGEVYFYVDMTSSIGRCLLRRISWGYLMEHLGTNESNYFLY